MTAKQQKYKSPIRIGFDFDGVLFYNPIRLLRIVFDIFKQKILGVPATTFYVAKTPQSTFFMRLAHKTSFMPNVGMDNFKQLINNPKFEVYIITARQKFLAPDLFRLLKKNNVNFDKTKVYYNKHDKQAHIHKSEIITKLSLDYFVEDNWDIVKYLRQNTNTQIVWVYNRVDILFIKDKFKAPNVKQAISLIKNHLCKINKRT